MMAMENKKIIIRMLSNADSVDGQGVGSAFLEQVALVKEQSDIFDVYVNKMPKHVKSDIDHVHTVLPKYYVKMNSKKRPSVIYVHFLPTTLDGSIKMWKPLFNIFKWYVVKMYRRADEIVVVNPIFINPLVELGIKREGITYIPNYVSKEQFHKIDKNRVSEIRKEYGIKENAFVVMGCGQVQTRKGVLDYVEVAKMNPDIEFIWAGGFSFGSMTDGYQELKKVMDNPPSNVHFIGIIKRDRMNDIFNMSDVLFMPSFNELFPMSILEAVNSSKPVLLRDLDLYRDILFLKYQKAVDNAGFSSIVRRLKDDPQFYQECARDSDFIANYYSKENVGKMWREYYPRILKKFIEGRANKKQPQ
jgi:1,2-diacylglycerol-3-alpha-glucose alpha-1,2-galactosyltransferase